MKDPSGTNKRIKIAQFLSTLEYGGSERLAGVLSYSVDRKKFEARVVGLFGGGPLTMELADHNIPFDFFEGSNGIERRVFLPIRVYNYLYKNHIDIVQVHGSYPLTRIILAAKAAGARVIYTEHAKRSLQKSDRLRYMTKVACLLCDGIVVVSDNLKEYFIKEIGVDGGKVSVIYNGVDLKKFDARKGYPYPEGLPEKKPSSRFVGVVGRLTEAKDHANLFRAWRKVKYHNRGNMLIVVGDGEKGEELKKLCHSLGIGGEVLFLGSREDIPNLIAYMDLTILPSKREGFPLAILEYMAMGKPVIATKVGGVPEIIEHGVNGYLIPPEDSDSLVRALESFFQEHERFRMLAINGKRTVEKTFSKEICLMNYEELYEQLYHS